MSELVEKVAKAIARQRWTEEAVEYGWDTYADEARAAIAAVAEWLDDIGKHTAAAELRAGSIMEAAP